jgi:hypothetical protein
VAGDITDEDVKRGALAGVDAAFVDPARRDPAGPRHHDGRARRVSNPELWSPPWSWVAALTSRVPRVVAKLAPGVPRDLAPGWELVWTSVGGHLVEAAAWAPALAREGVSRAAVVLRPGADTAEMTDDDDPFGEDELGGMAPTGPVGAYVLEPDDAVIRAGLVGALVASTGGWLLDPRLAYVSCDSEPDGVARLTSRAYRVLEVGPADVRNLRATVTRLGAGDVVIKQRGMRVDPVQLRRALRLTGDGPRLTVLLARIDSGAVAMVASPVPTAHLGRSPSN